MFDIISRPSRRGFLDALALGAAGYSARGTFADEPERTPRVQEGPFYPTKLPLDTDNDLLGINDAITPAVGEITHLTGKILDSRGEPIRNAVVEIWQCDRDGAYLKPHLEKGDKFDANLQGFGRFLTGSTGEYYFRTIKPVPYTGRPAAHIHFKIWKENKLQPTTECFVKGHPGNERDGLFRRVTAAKGGDKLPVEFAPIAGSKIGELAARFDVVLGYTPTA
ncbi:intradiol ring-cleavage dioxygenase [Paludisphaera mucosa]|uniref:Intradiol ring-cleavage dioxygenase n=1 Tax=Paludisphaera mucosa TaxID=3030827 RepID=A0ABT6F3V1_9BACT|nr:intradiol ring-cleavage dioxygenase [Paludisphaera mucosa]MDG3002240.1 intradiol ring-cleavage dioxygenase [Paludisphaera mucosa]